MITFFVPLFFLLFLMGKDFFFIGRIFSLDLNLSFMIFIFPLVFFLIWNTNFNTPNYKEASFFKFIFFFVIFFLFFCFSRNLTVRFLVFLENCVIFIIFLIFCFSKDLDKISSAFFIFFINIFPSILFIYFCWSWNINMISSYFFYYESLELFCFFCFIGLLVSKLPLFFFHFWLTKAHVRASGCGSMILASLLLKIGTVGFYKFYFIFLNRFKIIGFIFFSLVLVSSLYLIIIIIRFFDLKYLVACSSIIHIAPIFPLSMWGESNSIFGCFLIIVGHGLISYFIFFLVSLLYEVRYHRSVDYNKSLGSFSKVLVFFFIFFFLINLGFPPFVRFIRELFFLFSFINFREFSSFFFCLGLILRGFIFFFCISKRLFGKKFILNISVFDISIFFYSFIYLFIYFILPFIYLYSFSLKKILFCGSKDMKNIGIF